MKVLILEDEKLALTYLKELLGRTGYDIQIEGEIQSVKSGVEWFLKNSMPDLIFSDINLGDGLCFEIFEIVKINCPIIFTTAYDEYAIRAFKVNSIDYLLKPIELKELIGALDKYSKIVSKYNPIAAVQNLGTSFQEPFKSRFLVKVGDRIKSIPTPEIQFFESRNKATYLTKQDSRAYPIEYSLDKLEPIMDPSKFFRINRNFIINYGAIQDIVSYSNSRLKLKIAGADHESIVVSRERVAAFKDWLDR